MGPIIDVSGVDYEYKSGFWLTKTQALSQIHLRIEKNTLFALLGPNGAGKTTLMQLLTGVARPKRGQIQISGLPSTHPLAKMKIGYLPERPYLPDFLTGEQFLRLYGHLSGLESAHLKTRVPEVLEIVKMNEFAHTVLKKYSKGMLQRIGIAQAILHDPEIFVLDEPMSGLDPLGRRDLTKLLKDLHQKGKTIIFSTHLIADVEALSQEIGILNKGRLICQGKAQDFQGKIENILETGAFWSGPS